MNKVSEKITNVVENEGLESLKKYEKEVNNLKVLFDVKEEVVNKTDVNEQIKKIEIQNFGTYYLQ